ncbi:MAG TPA: M20/M25/M40 family metallo-hydrolase [Thermoanaerobaculia bacterium]|nr:M20/M25/M40 family metallo-hydrolase [Thermoanaerobaculia bacterium]
MTDPRQDPTIDLLSRLVAIDSVNPSLVPGGAGEAGMASALAEELASCGAKVEVTEAAPGRPNVLGTLEGRRPGPTLLFCGHVDTVGVAGMEAPFSPRIADGKLYGRGAVDMKGGVAAMVGAARRIAETGGLPAGRLLISGVADEEHASLGAEAVARQVRADAAVVTEPTGLEIAVGHKGFAWVEVTTHGRAAHGSRPREGVDAILHMGRFLARLAALDTALQSRPPHPLLGTASLHASQIEGGRELSTYPARCTLTLERRTLPQEPCELAAREVAALLRDLAGEDPAFRAESRLLFGRPGYETPAACPLPDLLEKALERAGRPVRRGGTSFWTDAAVLGQAGIPTVLFGPGGEGLHSREEYVWVEDVLACRDVLAEVAREFCAG